MSWLVLGVATATLAGAQQPTLDSLDPAQVDPYQGFTLVLSGQDFEPGMKVFIEGGVRGRYLNYQPSAITTESCQVDLPLGFGPRPASRRVYLESRDGVRSEALDLVIREAEVEPLEGESTSEQLDPDLNPDFDAELGEDLEQDRPNPETEAGSGLVPTIRDVSPSQLLAGRGMVLEVAGENFTEDSVVWVTVNIHAGSSRLPEYELKSFPTLYIDPGLLEVEFERGFYPVPGVRDVVVENFGGLRSRPTILRILREEG